MQLVDQARPERLGELVRALLVDHPELDVIVDPSLIHGLERGSTIVLIPKPEHATYLNGIRPAFSHRDLKVILFCDRETTIALKNDAPDFFDWISKHQECPDGPAHHAVLGIRAAVLADVPGIHWTGSDSDVASVWSAISKAFPGETLRWIMPDRGYEAMTDEIREAGKGWVACRARAETPVRRFRWALAETGKRTRAVVVDVAHAAAGFWPVHDRLMSIEEARIVLSEAGATHPICLAAMVGLEPEAVELAGRLVEKGMNHAEFVELLAGVEDPGATLAKKANELGILDEKWGMSPPALRAIPEWFREDTSAIEKELPELQNLGAWIERRIRGGLDALGWAEISEQAIKLGDVDAAASWALKSIELSGKILEPARRIYWEIRKRQDDTAKALQSAFKEEDRAIGPETDSPALGCLFMSFIGIVFYSFLYDLLTFKKFLWIFFGFVAAAAIVAKVDEFSAKRKKRIALQNLHIRVQRPERTKAEKASLLEDAPQEGPSELQEAIRAREEGRTKDAIELLHSWMTNKRNKFDNEHPYRRRVSHLWICIHFDCGFFKATTNKLAAAILMEGRIVGVRRASFAELMVELALLLQHGGDSQGAMVLLAKTLPSTRLSAMLEPLPNTPPANLPFQDTEAAEFVRLFVSQPSTVEKIRPEIRARAFRILAETLLSQGRYDEAEEAAKEAQAKNEMGQFVSTLEAFRALGIQGRACALAGRYDEGKELLRSAVELAQKNVGKKHIDTARLLLDSARMAHLRQDPDAIDIARRALGIYAALSDMKEEREDALAELSRIAEP